MEIKQAPPCTISIALSEKNESVSKQDYEQRVKDFQKVFDRFPYLKDVLCKIKPEKMDDLVKEKTQTTYDSDYKQQQRKHNLDQSKKNCPNEEEKDDENEELPKFYNRIILKNRRVHKSDVKYSGVAPPEPYVPPVSEYRSTIHKIGTRIIKEKLLIPRIRNKK